MYSLIRTIHLYACFFLAAFVMMYFVTGLIMIYESDFKRANQEFKMREAMTYDRLLNTGTLVEALQRRFDIRGQYTLRVEDQRTLINFRHPGATAEVIIPHDVDSVFVTKRIGNVFSTMHQFHRLHGFYGGLNYIAWSVMYDLSAVSMIIFALSGFYLWYKSERVRVIGWLVFGASTILTALTIIYFMYIT